MNTQTSKTELESLALVFKAFSHPARLAILQTLASRGTCICGEIVEVMPLSQATVSQHLKVLKDTGLISGEIDGQKSCYCLNQDMLKGLEKRLEALFGSLADCC